MADTSVLSGVIADWRFESANYSGGQVQDASGLGHHIDAVGTPSWSTKDTYEGFLVDGTFQSTRWFQIHNILCHSTAIIAFHSNQSGSAALLETFGLTYASSDHDMSGAATTTYDADDRRVAFCNNGTMYAWLVSGGLPSDTYTKNAWTIAAFAWDWENLKLNLKKDGGSKKETTGQNVVIMNQMPQWLGVGMSLGALTNDCVIGHVTLIKGNGFEDQSSALDDYMDDLASDFGV